jgi:hypothetical protein
MSRSKLSRRQKWFSLSERLEDRLCMAANVIAMSGVLYVTGDETANTIAISYDGQGGTTASVSTASTPVTGAGGDIRRIVIDARGGDDVVTFDLSDELARALAVNATLGRGNDDATFDLSAGITDARLLLNVLGGDGDDTVTADVGTLTDSHLVINATLGRGDDTFDAAISGSLVGRSTAVINSDGLDGIDRLTLDAIGLAIAEQSTLASRLDGGARTDTVAIDYSGQLDGKLGVLATGASGSDTIEVNLTSAEQSTGRLGTVVSGGRGNDNLTLNVVDNSGGSTGSTLRNLEAFIGDGLGTDTIVKTPNVRSLRGLLSRWL